MKKLLIIGAAAMSAVTSQGAAKDLPRLDSSKFQNKGCLFRALSLILACR